MFDNRSFAGAETGRAVDFGTDGELSRGTDSGPVAGADPSQAVEGDVGSDPDTDPDSDSRADSASDPYGVELPAGWSVYCRGGRAVYENPRGDHRVRIVEFSKGLSLYWWVDVYENVGGGDDETDGDRPGIDGDDVGAWRRLEVGLGDSYTDPEAAASAVESYIGQRTD
jgi:hypothetical protein